MKNFSMKKKIIILLILGLFLNYCTKSDRFCGTWYAFTSSGVVTIDVEKRSAKLFPDYYDVIMNKHYWKTNRINENDIEIVWTTEEPFSLNPRIKWEKPITNHVVAKKVNDNCLQYVNTQKYFNLNPQVLLDLECDEKGSTMIVSGPLLYGTIHKNSKEDEHEYEKYKEQSLHEVEKEVKERYPEKNIKIVTPTEYPKLPSYLFPKM